MNSPTSPTVRDYVARGYFVSWKLHLIWCLITRRRLVMNEWWLVMSNN